MVILNDALRGFGQEYYAVGKSKILMMTEVVALLEKAKAKAVSDIESNPKS
jgi:hypothetical protein